MAAQALVTSTLVASKQAGPQIWSTDESEWLVLWPQQPDGNLYIYRTNDEAAARAMYAQTGQTGFTAYRVAEMAGTAGPPSTMCLLLESATGWFVALLPETPPQSVAWIAAEQDARDTFINITTGWEY